MRHSFTPRPTQKKIKKNRKINFMAQDWILALLFADPPGRWIGTPDTQIELLTCLLALEIEQDAFMGMHMMMMTEYTCDTGSGFDSLAKCCCYSHRLVATAQR